MFDYIHDEKVIFNISLQQKNISCIIDLINWY